MRKAYQKPAFYAESFQLVEHITANCAFDQYNAQSSNGWVCAITGLQSGKVMFTTSISGCSAAESAYDASWKDDDIMESYIAKLCYNDFETGPMFSS